MVSCLQRSLLTGSFKNKHLLFTNQIPIAGRQTMFK